MLSGHVASAIHLGSDYLSKVARALLTAMTCAVMKGECTAKCPLSGSWEQ